MLLALLALSPLTFGCPALSGGVRFEVRPGVTATLRTAGDDRLTLNAGAASARADLGCSDGFDQQALAADFNFDGWRDVAVPTGVGYSGVNHFYTVYLYRPASRSFQKSKLTEDVANLEPDAPSRTVYAAYKSGPGYVDQRLCPTPDGRDLYICRRGELPLDSRQVADGFDWTWFAPDGRVVLARPLLRSGQDRSMWTVAVNRLVLQSIPRPDHSTRPYVVRGDQVEVLELRDGWAHVNYTDAKNQSSSGWVSRSGLK